MQYLNILDEEPICRFISGSHDQTILIWEWHREENSMECVHACRGHAGSVDCVAVNNDKDKVSRYEVKYLKMRKFLWTISILLQYGYFHCQMLRKRCECRVTIKDNC